jgi:hypothetical protein
MQRDLDLPSPTMLDRRLTPHTIPFQGDDTVTVMVLTRLPAPHSSISGYCLDSAHRISSTHARFAATDIVFRHGGHWPNIPEPGVVIPDRYIPRAAHLYCARTWIAAYFLVVLQVPDDYFAFGG